MTYTIYHTDCFEWAEQQPDNTYHAIVTDPPFGVLEFTDKEKAKLRAGRGGVWRLPPSFDGSKRKPLPRFTVLTPEDIEILVEFFTEWSRRMYRILVPGAHIFIAANPILSQHVWVALINSGFEKRGEIIRIVRTFRGGDRPKFAHEEFKSTCTMPRANYEPWGLFRKPVEGLVADNLRKWGTGALRRITDNTPFIDLIASGRTANSEREIAPHPSLKPQAFLRQIVRASLPLGQGIVLDPFMGSGSTLAAADAIGYHSVGVERDDEYYQMAERAIPLLSKIKTEPISFDSVAADSDFEFPGDLTDLPLFTPRLDFPNYPD